LDDDDDEEDEDVADGMVVPKFKYCRNCIAAMI
jgi:hypothetical protein